VDLFSHRSSFSSAIIFICHNNCVSFNWASFLHVPLAGNTHEVWGGLQLYLQQSSCIAECRPNAEIFSVVVNAANIVIDAVARTHACTHTHTHGHTHAHTHTHTTNNTPYRRKQHVPFLSGLPRSLLCACCDPFSWRAHNPIGWRAHDAGRKRTASSTERRTT